MATDLRTTPLTERHIALGAKMAPFAGWQMPIQYTGVRDEHRAVRATCGIFDVSHMGQLSVAGPTAEADLQRLLTNDISRLKPGDGQYTVLCASDGGVIDDLIVYRTGIETYLIVCNAANITPVAEWIAEHVSPETVFENVSDDYAMLAVQGGDWERAVAPAAGGALDTLLGLAYFQITPVTLAGAECLVARTGYTGEPGIEILCPADAAADVWDAVMGGPDAPVPAGLAARDTLRLEMGYPLYGNELSRERSPIEAGLGWVCATRTEFEGAERIRRDVQEGTAEELVMFELTEPGIPRSGCGVLVDGEVVGTVTSGTLSPSRDVGFGLAYVRRDLTEPGTAITIDIRGKHRGAVVRTRPLIDISPRRSA